MDPIFPSMISFLNGWRAGAVFWHSFKTPFFRFHKGTGEPHLGLRGPKIFVTRTFISPYILGKGIFSETQALEEVLWYINIFWLSGLNDVLWIVYEVIFNEKPCFTYVPSISCIAISYYPDDVIMGWSTVYIESHFRFDISWSKWRHLSCLLLHHACSGIWGWENSSNLTQLSCRPQN
jgi:hypothetical protein